jgi:hypothetical protein
MKRQIAVEVICFLFILLFVYAALNKLLDYQKFSIQIGQSPILTGFGSWLPAVVIGSELALAIMLMFSRLRLFALYGCFSVMIMFTVYIAAILNLGVFIPCSCGGVLEKLGWTEHLIFNCVFVMLALLGIILERSKDGGGTPRKRLVTSLSGSMVSSIAVVIGLIFFSGVLRDRRGSFLRLFPSHPVLEKMSYDIKYNSYYLAGATSNHVYLGNTVSPLHMLILSTAEPDTQHVRLNIEGITDQKFWSLRVAVDSPYFYAYDGAVPRIYRGQIDDWKAKRFDHDEEFFLDLVPLGPNSFFVKSLSAETKESVLGKIFTDSPYYYFDSSLLERQVDGVFCTDGIMLHNEEFNRLIYVYRYRNQFLLMDTSLHNIGIGNTIDTVTRAKVKVRAIDSGKTKTLAVPPPAVNNTAATYSHWLFVNSHLLAQNEHPKAHAEASVIDVYDLTSRAYLFSFYVRSPTKSQSLIEFVVRNNILISLFIDQVRIYDLNPAFFQTNKDNYARINRKVGRTPV